MIGRGGDCAQSCLGKAQDGRLRLGTRVRPVGTVQTFEVTPGPHFGAFFGMPLRNSLEKWQGFSLGQVEACGAGCPSLAEASLRVSGKWRKMHGELLFNRQLRFISFLPHL